MMNNDFVEASSNSNGSRLLDIRNLSVDYYAASGTVAALDNVSFTLDRGQILGLAGESGSGKSTLVYAITRLLRPPAVISGGEILYYPKDEPSLNTYGGDEGDRKGPHANTYGDEGDRKGPHPSPLHPRPYNDYENDVEGNDNSRGGGGGEEGGGAC